MMGRRRPRALGAWAPLGAVSLSLLASSAEAAPQRRDSGPLFTQIDTGQGAAASARALAVKGDCAHALAQYDIALHSSIDMTIRRDRGLCHEALGNPFPAMDDYRAYLTVSPDAPDSADIRARLERLEIQTGTGGPSQVTTAKSAEEVPDEPAQIGDVSIQTSDTGKRTNVKRSSYDVEEDAYSKYDRAMTSPLRVGTGGIFGLYSYGRAISLNAATGIPGAGYVNGYGVGASMRWSFSEVSVFYGEVGYGALQQLGVGSTTIGGGVDLAIGYELRIRLDQYATNQITLSPAFEYQYVVEGSTDGLASAGSAVGGAVNFLLPQGRVGYRHVFGYGIGLDFVFEAGEPILIESSNVGAAHGGFFGGRLALALAF
jgi:hypothetical protein